MAQKVTHGASLQCNKGSKSSNLSVSSQDFSKVAGQLVATENDRQANTNIKPFGSCSIKNNNPCSPSPTSWSGTTQKDSIKGFKILLDSSTCPCSVGGKISIQSVGHSENHNAS